MQRKEFDQYLLMLNHSSNVLKNLYWISYDFESQLLIKFLTRMSNNLVILDLYSFQIDKRNYRTYSKGMVFKIIHELNFFQTRNDNSLFMCDFIS
jgi:hypothetical protein